MTLSLFLIKQMSACNDSNLRELKAAYKDKRLFKESLPTDTFVLICEILKNLKTNKKFRNCFPKHMTRRVKKPGTLIKLLITSKKSVEKKKRKFLEAKSTFQVWLHKVIRQFFKKCLVLLCD